MSDELITFHNVSKSFKNDFWAKPFYALDNVNFSINEGEIIGFLGANGAGKTTSIKIMLQFIKPCKGEVRYSDKLGKRHQDIFKKIGHFPERPYFYPDLTGKQFICYMASISGVSTNDYNQRMNDLSARFKIDHALNRKIRGYSKGMLQRLGFVSALIHRPTLIILDEPLSGLDPVGRKEMKDVIQELKGEGKTIFFSSHIVSDVEEVCKKVVVLDQGKLFYEGDIDKLIDQNHQTKFQIHYISQDEIKSDPIVKECSEVELNELLSQLMGPKHKIIKVMRERPTLEEIIYKVRGSK